jgi:hypothetical protein
VTYSRKAANASKVLFQVPGADSDWVAPGTLALGECGGPSIAITVRSNARKSVLCAHYRGL